MVLMFRTGFQSSRRKHFLPCQYWDGKPAIITRRKYKMTLTINLNENRKRPPLELIRQYRNECRDPRKLIRHNYGERRILRASPMVSRNQYILSHSVRIPLFDNVNAERDR